MNYKVRCPSCGKTVSRWFIFLEPTIYHRCRGCGVQFRTSLTGALVIIGIEILWFVFEQMKILSPLVALGLIAATCCLAIWLLPYFTSTRLK